MGFNSAFKGLKRIIFCDDAEHLKNLSSYWIWILGEVSSAV